jgi:hypothetical protein
MKHPTEDWHSKLDILDEILYRDPSGFIRQLEVRDGVTRMVEMITFADGSNLALSAQVPLPPFDDMSPTQVTYLTLNGERGERWDDGSQEALDLARHSFAIRFLEKISKLLDEMPECEKEVCSACQGSKACQSCRGQGCQDCRERGICSTCAGHGLVAKI